MESKQRDPEGGGSKTNCSGSGGSCPAESGSRRVRRNLANRSMNKIMNLGNSSSWTLGLNYTLPNVTIGNDTDGTSSGHEAYLAAVVYGKTEMVLPNLQHFQEYSIEVSFLLSSP